MQGSKVDRSSRPTGVFSGRPAVAPSCDRTGAPRSDRGECTAEPGSSRASPGVDSDFHLNIFGWNVGGCDISDLSAAVREATSKALAPDAILALQELPRAGAGWAAEKQGLLQIVSHRTEQAWRGAGVAFNTEVWSVVRRVVAGRGVWIQLKHLRAGCVVWVGSVHLTPGETHSQSEQEMAEFMRLSPKGAVPAVCQCDANAAIRWGTQDDEVMPVGTDGKANEVLAQLARARFRLVPPGGGAVSHSHEQATASR